MTGRAAILGLAVIAALGCQPSRPPSWEEIDARIARDHPGLARIDGPSLAAWLGDPSRESPALVDTRSPDEIAVSRLPGAITADAAERLDHRRPVVTYCSVGVRSSAFADRLRQEGFAEVSDLRGGIFAWANAGRPLERDGAPVRAVHPYDARWGRLLDPDLRASSPAKP
jgi:rhodanese-related sulfurtransferase